MIVDHIAFGILGSNVLKRFRNGVSLFVFLFSSILPDIPVVFIGGPGTLAYLSHRVIFHSIILAPVFSIIPVILATILFAKYRKNTLLELYLIAFIAYCGHIFLDLLTPYGTQVFYPLFSTKFSLDLFHSFDPIYMAISVTLIGIFAFRFKSKPLLTKLVLIMFFALYLGYFCTTGILKLASTHEYEEYISQQVPDAHYISTIPRTFWRWKGIAQTNDTYIVIASDSNGIICKQYPSHSTLPKNIVDDDDYMQFMDYARFPVVHQTQNEVILTNLIYSPKSYRMVFKLDDAGAIISREITGFDLKDISI